MVLPAEQLSRHAETSDVAALLQSARECDSAGQGDAALEHLRRAAATGDVSAKTALGYRLLTRAPLDMSQGARVLAEAAAEGSGVAAHVMAILTGAGLVVGQSWRVALDYLQRAAELGHPVARAELALLAGEPEAENESVSAGNWERLRRKIDVRIWLAVPKWRQVSPELRMAIVDEFVSPPICNWLIERSRPHLKLARIDDPATGASQYGSNRTNSAAEFELAQTGFIMHLVRARISALAGPPPSAMEGSTVLHYMVGQQFFPHYDFLNTAEPGYARQVAQYGQRVLTFLIYLNEGYQGGETDFPTLSWRHKGKTGDALLFWNVQPNGQPDRRMLHAGLPPTGGEKFLFSQWVRGRVA